MKLPPACTIGLLVFCIAIPLLVGVIGSVFTISQIATWYAGLLKPPFNPPDWIFGPVWTLLYILMGIALWFVLREGTGTRNVRVAAILFAAQLAANLIWSVLFFGMHQIAASSIEVLILLGLIVATIVSFRRVSKTAGWLLVPYLCWTTFATVLTFSIWLLNGPA